MALCSPLESSGPLLGPRAFAVEDLLGPLTEFEQEFAPDALYVVGNADLLRSGRRRVRSSDREEHPSMSCDGRATLSVLS